MLALPFSPSSSGRHFAGFPVAIKTHLICVNYALINEIMTFGMISELVSTRFFTDKISERGYINVLFNYVIFMRYNTSRYKIYQFPLGYIDFGCHTSMFSSIHRFPDSFTRDLM